MSATLWTTSALQRRGDSLASCEELAILLDLDALLHARHDHLSAATLAVACAVAALVDHDRYWWWKPPVGRRADAGLAEALAARILELEG